MSASSIRNYVRTFANPLLAMAFKDGIDYVGDPDFRALDPKKEGDMWEVIIEHEIDDDDEDESPTRKGTKFDPSAIIGPVPAKNTVPEKTQLSLKDYEAKFDKMKPRPITATGKDEIIHPPVKVEEIKTDGGQVIKFYMPSEPKTKEPEPLPPPPVVNKPKQNLGYNQEAIEGIKPCNGCLNCSHGETCINIINAACLASMPM